ncbi:MAG: hypothetical protein K0Q59_6100 [Paenibacillus sp.]|nr:hypothetical protein [Paenibacillus sp.]
MDSDSPLPVAEWIERYAHAVYALAYSRIGDYHYAQDIAQETFLKAYLNRHFLKDPAKAGSWLYAIAARTSADWVRSNRVASICIDQYGELEADWTTEEIVIDREQRSSVWHALEQLDEASRTVLVLFHMNDWSLQEIGSFLNIGVKAVDSRLRRAREKLRDRWNETVESELRSNKPSASLQQKLLEILSDGNCDRLLVKEGLQLSGDVVTFNWEHNPDDLKYMDPADGTSEVLGRIGRLDANEWANLQWYLDEKLSVVVVNGKVIHATRGDYKGLSGQIGIGPAWSSVVTVRKLRVQENPKLDRHAALQELIQANNGERINIRMLARWSPDLFHWIRRSFESGRPRLMLTLESVSSPSLIMERAVAEDAPDLIPLRPHDIVPLLREGRILDLMPFAESDPEVMEEIFPGVLQNCMFDGKLAIIPFEPRIPGFLYKKDRFDEAGIPYPEPGWNWEYFLDTAIRLTKRDSAGNALQYGLVIQKDWAFVESMIVSNGGSLISEDGKSVVGYLDSDASVEAVQQFVDLFRVHKVAPIRQEPILQPFNFYNEKIGMFGEGSWMAQEGFIKPDNRMGTVGMPVMAGGRRASSILVSGYAISARSAHPQAAWDMLKRLIRPDEKSAKEWARHNVAWSKSMADRSGQGDSQYLGPFLAELPYAAKRAQIINPNLLRTSLTGDIFQELIVHGADVREALEQLARIVQAELDELD